MPQASVSRGRRRRGRRRTVWIGVCGALAVAVLGLIFAVTCRPAWYRPRAIDYARLPEDKRALVRRLDAIGAALNEGRAARIELDEEQVNRWIAARAEFWPDAEVDLGPLQHPQVSFMDGRVRAGALLERNGWQAVVSITCRVAVADDRVVVDCESARIGALPVPCAWLVQWLEPLPGADEVRAASECDARVALWNDWVWPNGKRRCRLEELTVTRGAAELALEPLSSRLGWRGD